jgi:hypothetical protein
MSRVFSRAVFALFLAGLGTPSLFAAPAAPAVPPPAFADLSRPVLHQSPNDAVLLVRSVLSASGTVEVRGKRVVVRDIPAVISRLQLMLDDFDHPRVDLRVVLQLVEASPTVMPATEAGAVPEPILGRLHKAFRYSYYRLVAQGGFEAGEGTDVRSLIGQDFPISFRLGTLQRGQGVSLRDFQLRRLNQAGEELGLIDTNLSLSLDRPLVLGLTTDESSSRALLVVITCTRVAQAVAP